MKKAIGLIDSGKNYSEVLTDMGLEPTESNLEYIEKLDTGKSCKESVRVIREELNFND